MNKPRKINSIQSLRSYAFLGILMQHCSLIRLGTWGVSLFFILSGFVLTYSYINKPIAVNIKSVCFFAWSKIKRLYPLHILMMFAVAMLDLLPLLKQANKEGMLLILRNIFFHALLLHDYDITGSIRNSLNGPTWYYSALVFLYFAFPFLLLTVKKYKKILHGIISLIICFILQVFISYAIKDTANLSYWTYFFPPYRAFDFFAGCNLGYIYYCLSKKKIKEERAVIYTIFEILVLAGNVFIVSAYIRGKSVLIADWTENSLIYQPILLLLIFVFAESKGFIVKVLSNKITIWIGNLTGYMFIIHEVVLYYFQAVYYKVTGEIIDKYVFQTIIVFAVTLLAAYIWKCIVIIFQKRRNLVLFNR